MGRGSLALVGLLIACSALASVHGAQLGERACTQGPAYWCSNLASASECNVVEYCIPVWKRRTPLKASFSEGRSASNSAVCRLSQIALRSIKSFSQKEPQLEKVTDFAKKACRVLVDTNPKFERMCKEITRANGLQVIALLKNGLEPETVAELLQHCSKAPASKLAFSELTPSFSRRRQDKGRIAPKSTLNSNLKSIDCVLCLDLMNVAYSFLKKNSTEAEIEEKLSLVCKLVPRKKTIQCNTFIERFTPTLVRLILRNVQPQKLCQVVRMCTRMSEDAAPKLREPVNAPKLLCPNCTAVMGVVYGLLTENKTTEEIEMVLETVCTKMFKSLQNECDNFIEQYTPMLIHLISTDTTPLEVCQLLHFCPKFLGRLAPLSRNRCHSTNPFKPPARKLKDLECTACKEMFQIVEDHLQDNATEAQIETVLERACTYFPSTKRTECDQLITKYTPLLIHLIVANFEPEEICRVLTLCHANATMKVRKQEATPKVTSAPAVSGVECSVCVKVILEVEKLLEKNSTEKDIEFALERVCAFLPSDTKKQCDELVEKYTPILAQLIEKDFPPATICTALGFCAASKVNAAPKPVAKKLFATQNPPTGKGEVCTKCMIIVTFAEKKLTSNRTIEDIEHALARTCDYVRGELRTECAELIEDNLATLIHMFVARLPPLNICRAIDLCPRKNTTMEALHKRAVRLLNTVATFQKPAVAGVECTLCVRLVTAVEDLLKANKTEQEIEKALEVVCDVLPQKEKDECKSRIVTYLPGIITLIEAEISPTTICTMFGFCPASKVQVAPKPLAKTRDQPKKDKGEVCHTCIAIVALIEVKLTSNRTIEDIEHALARVCDYVPGEMRTECAELIEDNLANLIRCFVARLPALKVCQALRLCPRRNTTLEALSKRGAALQPMNQIALAQKPAVAKPECALCVRVVLVVEDLLQKNITEQKVAYALVRVCAFLPDIQKQECIWLVKNYLPLLIRFIVKELPPASVCKMVELCSASKIQSTTRHAVRRQLLARQPAKKVNTAECDFCIHVINYVETFITKNSTEAEITHALENVCAFLPGALRTECDALVDNYTTILIQILVADFTPEEICRAIGFCSNKNVTRPTAALPKRSPKLIKVSVAQSVPAAFSLKCGLCINVANYAYSFLQKNSTIVKIEEVLGHVCNYFSESQRPECNDLVREYIPALANLIATGLSPAQICKAIDMCPAQRRAHWSLMGPCRTGPKYWCTSVEKAESCGVFAVMACHRLNWAV